MKSILWVLTFLFVLSSGVTVAKHQEEKKDNYTITEKASDTGRDAKRAIKKGYNRVEESVCMDGEVECAAEKVGNRLNEGKDAVIDKSKKLKNKVD